jgi:signal transduction histidine kinase
LYAFIQQHTEDILAEWETFARALEVGDPMDVVALRDHARQMLDVIVKDLQASQSENDQVAKAQGTLDASAGDEVTAAQEHGADRAGSGFTVGQMVGEFRALRASVLRLWTAHGGVPSTANLEEVTRFNEAIDQAVAESITRYTEALDRVRDRFLAILGHDLVNPLGAIMASSRFIIDAGELREPTLTLVTRIDSSATRMNRLVGDLLDYTRTRFGDGIPIVRVETDARKLINDVVSETRAAHPDRVINTELTGDLTGRWDQERLAQMLSNLIGNAVHHGTVGSPIRVWANGTTEEIEIAIHNNGEIIEKTEVRALFDAMKAPSPGGARSGRHLGLGLYIVDKIVRAHHGTIEVDSAHKRGTTFTVRLPRRSSAQ